MSLPGATALRDALCQGDLRAVDVVEAALARTDLLIGAEGIGAFLSVQAAAARQEAAVVDARLAAGEQPPLAGVPIALSDEVGDAGQPLGAASLLLRGRVATQTAPAADRLRRAGAIVLGRANVDALGLGTSTEASGYHTTLNPWDVDRVSGGRGGAAAAVAAGATPLALGSDLAGELRQAAAFCGVAALRPTPDRASAREVFSLAPSRLAVGTIARSSGELLAMAQLDGGPAVPTDLSDVTVGIVMEAMGRRSSAPVKAAVNAALAALEAAGARLRPISLPSLPHAAAALLDLVAVEVGATIEDHEALAQGGELILDHLLQRARVLVEDHDGQKHLAASRALAGRVCRELMDVLDSVDAVATPTTPDVAFRFGEHTDDPDAAWQSLRWTAGASLAGLPALSVPVGLADLGLGDRMPAGLQLIGGAGRDRVLLDLGSCIEAALASPPTPGKTRW